MLFHGLWQHTVSIPGKVFLIRVPSPQEAEERTKNRGCTLSQVTLTQYSWNSDGKVLLEIPNDYFHYNDGNSLRCRSVPARSARRCSASAALCD